MGTPADRDQAVGQDGAGAATIQVRTCQWTLSHFVFYSSSILSDLRLGCNQPLDLGHPTLCILHNRDRAKDWNQFDLALQEKIEREETDSNITHINLAGVVFPADFRDRVFRKMVIFAEAEFGAQVDFIDAQFNRGADFQRARFGGDAFFQHAHFGGEAVFAHAHFGGAAYFVGAHFSGAAYFRDAHFERRADFRCAQFGGPGYFIGTRFPPQGSAAVVYLSGLKSESARNLRLEGVDLARVSFMGTEVSQMQFVGCTWADKPTPLLWPLPIPRFRQRRTVIYDELVLDEAEGKGDLPLVMLLYRQLRLNYESSRQEAEAGHFYVGQMEMRRQDPAYPWFYRWLLGAYRVLAMYGESYLRPPFFYFLLGIAFALAYLWGGFQVGQAQVKYQWLNLDWGNTVSFFQHFVRAYVQALTAGGLLGTNLLGGPMGASLETTSWWVPAVRYVNMLLDTFLVGFFVIALRRHFHR